MWLRKISLELILAAVLFFGVFPVVIAQTQVKKPTPLVPNKQIEPSAGIKPPKIQMKPFAVPKKSELPPPSVRARIPLQINVEELEEIDSDSVGTLTEEQGGFGNNMWEGTNRSLVEMLLPKLPVKSSSRTMRSLMRRLLLSVAKSPSKFIQTGNEPGPKGTLRSIPKVDIDGKLLSMRIERLSAMGEIDAVYNLLKMAPNRDTDPILLRNEADALFLSNDNSRACDLVMRQIRKLDMPYWQKALIYCQALSGNQAQANLGANLLREAGEKDGVFFGLLNSLIGIEEYKITELSKPMPLHFSMIRAAKVKLLKGVTSTTNPVVLKTIATSPNAEPALRIDAAERAEAIGVLETDILRQIYASVPFTQEVLDNAVSKAIAERSAVSRALLFRRALVENEPSAKVEILSEVFKLAREVGLFELTSRVYYRILKDLAMDKDLIWFAPEAVRALLAAGDAATAITWFNMLQQTSTTNREIRVLRDKLFPLAWLTGQIPSDEWDSLKLDNWWKVSAGGEKKEVDMETVRARATLLFNLLEALGDKVPGHRWEALLAGPSQLATVMPQSALWQMLNQSAHEVKRGEVVLISLLTLGQLGPKQINPIVLRKIIASLNLVGLTSEARALAIEAAIASGL